MAISKELRRRLEQLAAAPEAEIDGSDIPELPDWSGDVRAGTAPRETRIIDAWIPPAVISHPWADHSFEVKHPRQEPRALAAHTPIRAGGVA